MRTFRGDLDLLRERLARREPFAFARFGNGEAEILDNRPVETIEEYRFLSADPDYAACRERLLASLRYRSPSYFVGIACPHCIGRTRFQWLRELSGQDEEHLTWATLFFYSNYAPYLDTVVPLYRGYEVFLVCHRAADLSRLPFPVSQDFRVGNDAWLASAGLAEELEGFVAANRLRGRLFLLCAGPFGGILAHRLHAAEAGNTYLDIGSTLDPFFFPGAEGLSRRYLRRPEKRRVSCRWL